MQGNNRGKNLQGMNFIEPEGFTKLWVFVLLYIVTFGIYMFFWIYKTVGLLNKKTGSQDGQVQQLLLCMFVPFYVLYWLYKYSNKLVDHCNKSGFGINNISTTCMILAVCGMAATVFTLFFFYLPVSWVFSIAGYTCTIIAYALMQNTINGYLVYEMSQENDMRAYAESTYRPASRDKEGEMPLKERAPSKSVAENTTRKSVQNVSSDIDVVSQLRELKMLYDEGILTEEEFNYKKRELLK